MDIVELISERKSLRVFKADPVPKGILTKIIELSQRAPSFENTQPWQFVVVGGSKIEALRKACAAKSTNAGYPDLGMPAGYPEPYTSRRRTVAAKIFEIEGIKREDKAKRAAYVQRGIEFFGAPNVIYICADRPFIFQENSTNVWPIFDCGVIAENIMLLAANYGLGTIAEIQAAVYPDVVRKMCGITEDKLIMLGIAIGYPDMSHPLNLFRTEREPVDNVVTWHGFD
jgi:nitroreductase